MTTISPIQQAPLFDGAYQRVLNAYEWVVLEAAEILIAEQATSATYQAIEIERKAAEVNLYAIINAFVAGAVASKERD